MRSLDLPAGSTIRLTATARPNVARHRWDMLVFTAGGPGDAHPRLTFGSEIGGDDREQRIDVPAQDKDCRVEVTSRHAIAGGCVRMFRVVSSTGCRKGFLRRDRGKTDAPRPPDYGGHRPHRPCGPAQLSARTPRLTERFQVCAESATTTCQPDCGAWIRPFV